MSPIDEMMIDEKLQALNLRLQTQINENHKNLVIGLYVIGGLVVVSFFF